MSVSILILTRLHDGAHKVMRRLLIRNVEMPASAASATCDFRRWIWAVYLLPALLVLLFVWHFGANVPRIDQWGMPDVFAQVADGKDLLPALWAPNNEHRVLIPKLVFTGLAFTTKWDIRAELLLNWFTLAAGCVLLVLLARATRRVDEREGSFHAVLLGSVLAYFTLVQHQNFLWGFQFPFFAVQTFLLGAVWILSAPTGRPWLRLFLAACCCVLASFSMAQGLVTWAAVGICVWRLGSRWPERMGMLAAWLLCAVICALVYFHGLNQRAELVEDPRYALTHPFDFLKVFCALAGSQFAKTLGFQSAQTALLAGMTIIASFASLVLLSFSRRLELREIAPWIAVGCFGGLATAAVAYGRVEMGPELLARVSRYATGPPLIVVASLQLLRLNVAPTASVIFHSAPILAGATVAVAVMINSKVAFDESVPLSRKVAMAEALLPLLDRFDPVADDYRHGPFRSIVASLKPPFGGAAQIRQKMPLLERLGFRSRATELHFEKSMDSGAGMVEAKLPRDSNVIGPRRRFELMGTVVVKPGMPEPEAVVITRDDSPLLFLAAPLEKVESTSFGERRYRWQVRVSAEILRPGESSFSAWSYDRETMTFRLLNGSGLKIWVDPDRKSKKEPAEEESE